MTTRRVTTLWRRALVALAIGLATGVVAWLVSRGDCETFERTEGGLAWCNELVAGLAVRLGIVATAVALVMALTSAGLLRTAETLEEQRREADLERRAEHGR